MDTTAELGSIERELAIAASPETIWEFLVDPDKATQWMGTSASFDPVPGGEYRVEVLPGVIASGAFVELDPPHRLVYTFGWEPGSHGANDVPPGSTTVEIELVPDGAGTTLRFRHLGLPTARSTEQHGHGWEHYLARLSVCAAGGDPGLDPWRTGGAAAG
jgi:uncharacterized protein YndB with AHSA1/START domain